MPPIDTDKPTPEQIDEIFGPMPPFTGAREGEEAAGPPMIDSPGETDPGEAFAGWLIAEPDEDYREQAHNFLGSHALADFRACPETYRQKRAGLIPGMDSEAFAFGRAAHTRILEGAETMRARYAIGGPINPKTGQPYGAGTKAYND